MSWGLARGVASSDWRGEVLDVGSSSSGFAVGDVALAKAIIAAMLCTFPRLRQELCRLDSLAVAYFRPRHRYRLAAALTGVAF